MDEFGTNSTQTIRIRFHKQTLEDIDLYLEQGDIIEYNSLTFEINQKYENQFIAGRPGLSHSIIVECNITSKHKNKIDEVKKALYAEEKDLYK